MDPMNASVQRDLRRNARTCQRHNILVSVDRIEPEHNAAFCTVEQLRSGVLRRNCSAEELLWRAEKALSPLASLGVAALITVRHRSMKGSVSVTPERKARTSIDPIPDILRWLGWPILREGFTPLPLLRDPFGWHRALRATLSR